MGGLGPLIVLRRGTGGVIRNAIVFASPGWRRRSCTSASDRPGRSMLAMTSTLVRWSLSTSLGLLSNRSSSQGLLAAHPLVTSTS
jgi:hypothetical protein